MTGKVTSQIVESLTLGSEHKVLVLILCVLCILYSDPPPWGCPLLFFEIISKLLYQIRPVTWSKRSSQLPIQMPYIRRLELATEIMLGSSSARNSEIARHDHHWQPLRQYRISIAIFKIVFIILSRLRRNIPGFFCSLFETVDGVPRISCWSKE